MALDTIPKQEGGKLKAVASGTLPSGQPVVVNADGTVSVAEGSSEAESLTDDQTYFSGANIYGLSGVYDSTNAKVVMTYADSTNSYRQTAVVGTLSGTSITWGTPVVFDTNTTYKPISCAFDSVNGKVVIAYSGGSSYGTAVVGTVSGNSISFGTPTVYQSVNTDFTQLNYHTSSGKMVVTYIYTGTSVNAAVGTVSGTSISFGSPSTISTRGRQYTASTYHVAEDKIVTAYKGVNPSTFQAEHFCAVGTVSGTSISYGASVSFLGSQGAANEISIAYDTSSQKAVIVCRDEVNNTYGSAVVGTVSGTSISFGTPVTFQSGSTNGNTLAGWSTGGVVLFYRTNGNDAYIKYGTVSGTSTSWSTGVLVTTTVTSSDLVGFAMDSANNKLAITYVDSNVGKYAVYNPAYTSTNLTAENYIGMSTGGAVADGDNATVDIVGTVNKEQSGLTPGQQYYVQTDGTIGTTPADPSVLAGTAVSATKMVVKS